MVQLPSKPSMADPASSVPGNASVQDEDDIQWDILSEEWLSDEPELESDLHRDQIDLLLRLMKWYWRDRNDVYCSGNTTVYYDESQRTNRNFRGPDIYVVLDADPRRRNSWMIWREGGKYPNVVIELLSNSTAKVDRTTKKELYERVWRLPNYFWFHPYTQEFQGFQLVNQQYQPLAPNAQGHLWSEELKLFLGVHDDCLRLFTPSGELILTEAEQERQRAEQERQRAEQERQQAEQERQQAEQERQRAEQERQRAEQERQRAERLAQRLRELGIDPDS
jgi:Uma2 family endonuclease